MDTREPSQSDPRITSIQARQQATLALNSFLARYLEDLRHDRVRSLEEYQDAFPDQREAIAREHGALQSGEIPEPNDDAQPIERIGHYRLLEELGRGGQGVVYHAEDERLSREVALKLLTGFSLLSESSLSRFVREAEIASRLNDPGICKVYERGRAQEVPYIAMEYVDGPSLGRVLELCRSQAPADGAKEIHLDSTTGSSEEAREGSGASGSRHRLRRIVRLFEEIASSLHAAHEAGIVHRDMKPGNVLLAGGTRPVIVDFGLAREFEGEGGGPTRTGDVLGTPAYMAPEQVSGRSVQADRRTDVYSLGVMLYECLTLRRPFEAPTREGLFRAILQEEPKNPGESNPSIPPDLRLILATALEKDPDRRYQSALDLAEDLRRFREEEPISVRPPSRLYRASRFVRRHRAVVAVTTALVAVLIAGLATFLVMYVRAEGQRKRLEDANVARTQETKKAEAVLDFITRTFGAADPLRDGAQVLVVDVLDRAVAELGNTFEEEPEVRAHILGALGSVFVSVGEYRKARPLLSEAFDLRMRELGDEHPDTAYSMNSLALALQQLGETEEAGGLFERVLEVRRTRLPEQDERVLQAIHNLGRFYQLAERFAESESSLREALAGYRDVLGPKALETLIAQKNLASVLAVRGRRDQVEGAFAEAQALVEAAILLLEEQYSEDHIETLRAYNELAGVHLYAQRSNEAIPHLEKALAGMRRVFGDDMASEVVRVQANLAATYMDASRFDEAEPALREAITKLELLEEGESPTLRTLRQRLQRIESRKGDSEESDD